MMPFKELFEQQTGCAVQDVPLTPMAVMGEQVTPTWPVTPLRTTPRSPSSVATEGDDADWTELQHCWSLTLHWDNVVAVAVAVTVTVFVLAGVVVGEPHGVATARMGTSARTATLLNNIVKRENKLVRARAVVVGWVVVED